MLPLLLGLCATACPSSGGGGPDAADGSAGDAPEAGPGDARPVPRMVDFTVGDCPRLDSDHAPVPGGGAADPDVRAADLGQRDHASSGTSAISRSSDESLPVHTYVLPGTYDVGITGMPGRRSRSCARAYVVVTPNPLGDACDVDRQCDMEPV